MEKDFSGNSRNEPREGGVGFIYKQSLRKKIFSFPLGRKIKANKINCCQLFLKGFVVGEEE